jgi:hypothetical protein
MGRVGGVELPGRDKARGRRLEAGGRRKGQSHVRVVLLIYSSFSTILWSMNEHHNLSRRPVPRDNHDLRVQGGGATPNGIIAMRDLI